MIGRIKVTKMLIYVMRWNGKLTSKGYIFRGVYALDKDYNFPIGPPYFLRHFCHL